MKKLTNYPSLPASLKLFDIEKVYPQSIFEKTQCGEILVDDTENPKVALFWHYCGFANLVGAYEKEHVDEVIALMQHPIDGHSGRLVLQVGMDDRLQNMMTADPSVLCGERYVFKHNPDKAIDIPTRKLQCEPITAENYDILTGRIIPSFSWNSRESFLQNGFGFCIRQDRTFVACAFSSAISSEYVDIGVETAKEFQGNGYGKLVASAMIEETYRRNRIPVWGCDIHNEGSMRLACSVGFEVQGTHPWYRL